MTTPTSPAARADFRCLHRLRVRWAEVDLQRIVFNAHYLTYFDIAVADYWRAVGLPYEEAMHQLGGDLYVKTASLEYHASAHLDDWLDVALRCERIGTSSMRFHGAIFRGDQCLIGGQLLYVFADPATQTSRPVPPALREMLTDYEAGRPVLTLRTGSWDGLGQPAGQVRTRVFVHEQGIAPEDEWDEADATAVHAVVFNRLEQPLATGRLLQAAPGVAKIGRMAVHAAMRGSGLGRQVLRALMEAARARGDREVMLHAQRSAQAFYEREGFAVRGEPFDEVGIPHVEMVAPLGRD